MSQEIDLLPCPFCGSPGEWKDMELASAVICSAQCQALGGIEFSDEEWNTRAPINPKETAAPLFPLQVGKSYETPYEAGWGMSVVRINKIEGDRAFGEYLSGPHVESNNDFWGLNNGFWQGGKIGELSLIREVKP